MLRMVLLLLLLSNVAQASSAAHRSAASAISPAASPAPHAVSVSPDGTISSPPSGGPLTTTAGTWSWGPVVSGRPGEYQINLNGAWTGTGLLMEVANGGQLYAKIADGSWHVWGVGSWSNSSAPPPAPTGGVTSVTGSGTVACSPTTGAVKCTGSSVPGPAGPAGPQGVQGVAGPAGPGPINRAAPPVIGSVCKDGDSLYAPDHSTNPPKIQMFLCDYPNLVWIGPYVLSR